MATDTMPRWLHRILGWTLALVLVILPFHAFLSTWVGTYTESLTLWKSWKEVLISVVALPVLVWVASDRKRFYGFMKNRVMQAVLAFVVFSILLTLVMWNDTWTSARLAGLAFTYRYLLMFVLAFIWVRYGNVNKEVLGKRAVVTLIEIAAIVAAFGVLQATVLPKEFLSSFGYEKGVSIAPYVLIDENPSAVRAFSTFRGPNDFAAFLILPIVAVLAYAYHEKRSLRSWLGAALVLMLWALFLSGSRSGWLGALVAIGAFFAFVIGKRWWKHRRFRVALGSGLLVGASLIGLALVVPEVRLQVFHSSPSDTTIVEGSTTNHWQATASGLVRVVGSPFGCGAGCAGPASYYGDEPRISENYYVQIAEEFGLVGLLLWVAAVGLIVYELYRTRAGMWQRALLASFFGLSLVGLWLHVWADDPVSMIWFGVAGGVLAARLSVEADENELKKAL